MTVVSDLLSGLTVEIDRTRLNWPSGGGRLLVRSKREPDVDVVVFDHRRLRHAWLATLEVDEAEVLELAEVPMHLPVVSLDELGGRPDALWLLPGDDFQEFEVAVAQKPSQGGVAVEVQYGVVVLELVTRLGRPDAVDGLFLELVAAANRDCERGHGVSPGGSDSISRRNWR